MSSWLQAAMTSSAGPADKQHWEAAENTSALTIKNRFYTFYNSGTIVWGVTQNSSVLQRRGWGVYKRKDSGCFLLSSSLPAHPCILQVTTHFLSSGNLQNLPWGSWCLSAAVLAFCMSSPHCHLISTATGSQSSHFLTHLSSHSLHAEVMQWEACLVTTL